MLDNQALERGELEIQLELENCDLGESQRRRLEEDLRRLRKMRWGFPGPRVHVCIQRHVPDRATSQTASCP